MQGRLWMWYGLQSDRTLVKYKVGKRNGLITITEDGGAHLKNA